MKHHVTVKSFLKRLSELLFGPFIWFVHFSGIYAVAGFGPAFGMSQADIRVANWILTALACAALFTLLWIKRRAEEPPPDVDEFASGYFVEILCLLSLAGILLEALALWLIPLRQ
jgi:hypothetical protein